MKTTVEISKESTAQALRRALSERETMIADLCRKGVATRTHNGVNVFDTHPIRVKAWKTVDSAYWSALQTAADAGAITLHNHTFSWV